jgi:hypothetical protein
MVEFEDLVEAATNPLEVLAAATIIQYKQDAAIPT